MVVVCRLIKMAHFIPTSSDIKDQEAVDVFYDWILRLHGVPKTIVSDRDPKFISTFWTTLFTILAASLNIS
jgi:hypothetical protein